MYINKIPLRFRYLTKKSKKLLLAEHKDTRGIFLIGSIVDGTYNKSSDIDLVWVKSCRLNFDKRFKVEERLNSDDSLKIQLVPFTRKQVLQHFDQASTMAHAIQKGIVIYGKRDSFILRLLNRRLSLPTQKWMKEWFEYWLKRHQWAKDSINREKRFHRKYCKTDCHCTVFDDIARVAVNFAILYLEIHQIIPLSKTQIIKNIKKHFPYLSKRMLEGLELALKFSGKDGYLTIKEADKILFSANWFKARLNKALMNGR